MATLRGAPSRLRRQVAEMHLTCGRSIDTVKLTAEKTQILKDENAVQEALREVKGCQEELDTALTNRHKAVAELDTELYSCSLALGRPGNTRAPPRDEHGNGVLESRNCSGSSRGYELESRGYGSPRSLAHTAIGHIFRPDAHATGSAGPSKQRNTIAAHLEDNAQGRPPTQVFCGSEAGDH